jgi:predicted nucleic acid-binding protein
MSVSAEQTHRPFVDTNVLLYLLSADSTKADRAETILREGIVVSAQVLNEFASVARRKLKLEWAEVTQALGDIRRFARIEPLTLSTHERGLELAQRYQFGLYDAMIVAAALQAQCTILWSEDFSAGQTIARQLRVRNPFL